MTLAALNPVVPAHPGRARAGASQYLAAMHAVIASAAILALLQTAFTPNIFFAAAAVAVFAAQLVLIALYQPSFFVVSFPIIFAYIGATLSMTMIEGGGYMIESRITGYATGATARHVALCSLFLAFANLAFSVTARKSQRIFARAPGSAQIVVLATLALYAALILAMGVLIAQYGSALTLGVDRFTYYNEIAPPIMQVLYRIVLYLAVVIGMINAMPGQRFSNARRAARALFAANLVILILIGHKLSALFLSGLLFAIPGVVHGSVSMSTHQLSTILRIVKVAFALWLLGLPLIIYHYSELEGHDSEQRIKDRSLLQGQVYWYSDNRLIDWTPRPAKEIGEVLTRKGFDNGLDYLMRSVLPLMTYEQYADGNVQLTMGFPAINLVLGGWLLGAISVALCGVVWGFAAKLLYCAILSRDLVFVFVAAKLYFAAYMVSAMGHVDIYLAGKTYLLLAVVLGILLLYRINSRHLLCLINGRVAFRDTGIRQA